MSGGPRARVRRWALRRPAPAAFRYCGRRGACISRGNSRRPNRCIAKCSRCSPTIPMRCISSASRVAARAARGGLSLIDRAVAVNPRNTAAFYNRAGILRDMARFEEALQSYDRALALKADHFGALNNRGAVLMTSSAMARRSRATTAPSRSSRTMPMPIPIAATTLVELGRFEEALQSFDRSLAMVPDSAAAHFGRGNALAESRAARRGAGKLRARAVAHALRRAHPEQSRQRAGADEPARGGGGEFQPRDHRRSGICRGLQESRRCAHSSETPRRSAGQLRSGARVAPQFMPSRCTAARTRSASSSATTRRSPPIGSCSRAKPDHPYGHGMLLHAKRTACDWQDHGATRRRGRAGRSRRPQDRDAARVPCGFGFGSRTTRNARAFSCATGSSRSSRPLWRGERYRHDRIRLVYLSADFGCARRGDPDRRRVRTARPVPLRNHRHVLRQQRQERHARAARTRVRPVPRHSRQERCRGRIADPCDGGRHRRRSHRADGTQPARHPGAAGPPDSRCSIWDLPGRSAPTMSTMSSPTTSSFRSTTSAITRRRWSTCRTPTCRPIPGARSRREPEPRRGRPSRQGLRVLRLQQQLQILAGGIRRLDASAQQRRGKRALAARRLTMRRGAISSARPKRAGSREQGLCLRPMWPPARIISRGLAWPISFSTRVPTTLIRRRAMRCGRACLF